MNTPIRPGDPASRLYFVVVEPTRRPRRTSAVRWLLGLAAAVAFGETAGPSVQDVVLRRRTTGVEVLRLDVADGPEADLLLERLDDDLECMTLEEFGIEWNVPVAA